MARAPRAYTDGWIPPIQTIRNQDCSENNRGYTAGAQNIPLWSEISHDRPNRKRRRHDTMMNETSVVAQLVSTYFECLIKHFWYKNYSSDSCMRDCVFCRDINHPRCELSKSLWKMNVKIEAMLDFSSYCYKLWYNWKWIELCFTLSEFSLVALM